MKTLEEICEAFEEMSKMTPLAIVLMKGLGIKRDDEKKMLDTFLEKPYFGMPSVKLNLFYVERIPPYELDKDTWLVFDAYPDKEKDIAYQLELRPADISDYRILDCKINCKS